MQYIGNGIWKLTLGSPEEKTPVTMVNSDPVANTGEGHAPVPFFVSTAGYGVYVDTYRYATFLMGTNSKKGEGKKNIKEIKEHVEFAESALYALKKSEQ